MIPVAGIFISAREWLWPSAGILAAAFILVGISYLRTGGPHSIRMLCAMLKLLGVALLIACLLEPMWSEQRAKPGANLFAVVADNSRSMEICDKGATGTRGALLAKAINGAENSWRLKLSEHFDVRNYVADARLQPTRDFGELTFAGDATAIANSLKSLLERHRGQPLAGVLLMTDGVIPDLDAPGATEGLPPVYPVIFADDGPERDIAIVTTSVTQTSFEDSPVTIEAAVTAAGFAGEEITAELFQLKTPAAPGPAEDGGEAKPVIVERLKAHKNSERVTFRMKLHPAQTGVLFYRLVVHAARKGTGEATLANNETVLVVDRGNKRQRVLYVSGRPNWEFKFLNRALLADEQTQLVGLIRIAKREPKFEFRGRAGESSNPLFRGFGSQSKEEVERYDQPVLVRIGTEDQAELAGGFPKRAEDLYRYRAVIIDDLEAEFFTADQMSLLQEFVSERGGGMLMLGGAESFREGKYARNAIGDMLPVYLDARAGGAPPRATDAPPLKLALTREGWLQPWARLRPTEGEERARLDAMPPSDVLNVTADAKPAATVVANVSDGTREYPAIVTQRFGRGRTAAVLIGDLFQAGLGDDARQADLGRGWRQLVRWLIADVPDAIEVRAEPSTDGVKIQVRARDAKFQPLENAAVTLAISSANPGAKAVRIPAEASAGDAGLYEATYFPRGSGGYRVEATIQNESGVVAGTAQAGWTTDLARAEFRDLRPNRAALAELARKTGGRVVTPGDLARFANDLPREKAPVHETFTQPLWHTPWVLLAALACFVFEWGIRRRSGLA